MKYSPGEGASFFVKFRMFFVYGFENTNSEPLKVASPFPFLPVLPLPRTSIFFHLLTPLVSGIFTGALVSTSISMLR